MFKVFKYEGSVSSNENKKIIPYNVNNQTENTLPTHHRILRLLKIPRILKIITKETASDLISTNTLLLHVQIYG